MFNDQNSSGCTVIRRRMSFLSVACLSLSFIIVTAILCGSGIAMYGLTIVDRKSDSAVAFVTNTLSSLPEIRESLPPVLADAMSDVRRPDYRENLDVSVRLPATESQDRHHYGRAIVEVKNRGEETVSLMSLRVVGLDRAGDPIVEQSAWAATPIQADDEWRGPLLPGATRQFPVRCRWMGDCADVSVEITELRVWVPESERPVRSESVRRSTGSNGAPAVAENRA